MRDRFRQVRGAMVAVAVAASGAAAAGACGPAVAPVVASAPVVRPYIVEYGHVSPHDDPFTSAQCQTQFQINCYNPEQIQQGYGATALFNQGINGTGKTIVLIDVFGSPAIGNDLHQFDAFMGGPDPSLRIIKPEGSIPRYNSHNKDMVSWASESTLDVEFAHVMAPGAKLVLLELPSDGGRFFAELAGAVEYVVKHHIGDVISQSFGETEQAVASSAASLAPLSAAYADAASHHITVVAATGDTGSTGQTATGGSFYTRPVTDYPATDPMVTAVGGTSMNLDAQGTRLSPDTVWNDTWNAASDNLIYGDPGPDPNAAGGGRSAFFSRPSYQSTVKNITGRTRGIPDIAMSAACTNAVNVYQSFAGATPGWYPVCGTSEAAPEMAGVVALADQMAKRDLGLINPALYELAAQHAPGILQVTSGGNGVQFTQGGRLYRVRGYSARHGYSLAAGVGTLNVQVFVPELAKLG